MADALPDGYQLIDDTDFIPLPAENVGPAAPGARGVETPVTFYSLSRRVGGADETHDKWTDRGFSSKGQNLTPGVAAVNDKVYPLGTVLRDAESGQVFLATDRHGNADPNVVDIYVPPDAYQQAKVARRFEVAGRVDKVPTTPEGVRAVLAEFGTVPEGESAVESLARISGKQSGKSDRSQLPEGYALMDEFGGIAVADEQDRSQLPEGYTLEPDGPEVPFWEKVKQRWRLGREQAVDDQLAYRAMMGEVPYEDVKAGLDPAEDALKGKAWFSEGLLGAVQMVPAMVDGMVAGVDMGVKSAAALGGAAAVAGQAGPQALAPEEILTVPGAAAAGWSAGQNAGTALYWYKQGAGSLYHELRKEGVPHGPAGTVAAAFGVPYAAIELSQVAKLIPGMKQSAAHLVAGGIKRRLAALAKEKGVEYVEQIGQETGQELLQIGAEALAEWAGGVEAPQDKQGAWERVRSTISQTAASIPFLMGPKLALDARSAARGVVAERRTAAKDEFGGVPVVDPEALAPGRGAEAQFEEALRRSGVDVNAVPADAAAAAGAEFAPVASPVAVAPADDAAAAVPVADEFGGVPVEDVVDPFALDPDPADAAPVDYVPGGVAAAVDDGSGAALPDDEAARAHAQYLEDQAAEVEDTLRQARVDAGSEELLAKVLRSGGLPGRGHEHEGQYLGELNKIREGVNRGLAMRLFSQRAMPPDVLVTSLRDSGFAIDTPEQLWNVLEDRLRSGREVWSEPAVDARFSKEDPERKAVHALALPQSSIYGGGLNERNDPAAILADILRETEGASVAQRRKPGRQLAGNADVLAWADRYGRKRDAKGFREQGKIGGGGEHSIFQGDDPARLLKVTKPNLYGAQGQDAGQYLQRWALSNRVFDDDVRVEGVIELPGDEGSRLVISQPKVEGRDADADEQRAFLQAKGFVENGGKFIHPTLGLAVWDTNTPGNVIVRPDGSMQAVDLQIAPANAAELQAVRNRTGIGLPTAFSKQAGGAGAGAQSRAWIAETLARWGSKLPVVVHESAGAIGDAGLRRSVVAEGGGVEAFFDGRDGVIHILADRVATREDAERLLRHEGMHWAFAGPLRAEYEALLESVAGMIPMDRLRELRAAYPNSGPVAWVEEWLAYEGQGNPESKVWRRFVYELKRLLRRVLGERVELSEADVLEFLAKANRVVERGAGPAGGVALRMSKGDVSMAADALRDGPIRVYSADGRDAFAKVQLRGLPDIKIIEMPEMLALARELMGSDPKLRRMRSAMGVFLPSGEGQISLDPRIFHDSSVAAKVLAHEMGHLADWLPDHNLKRGNIIGRLQSLRKHLKKTPFGALTGVKEADLRAELVALTKYWHPWDEAVAPKWYSDYRKSSAELYADAISVLFNSPATLKGMAPKFYKEFFAHLDRKPDVKREFFELQALLNRPMMELLQARSGRVRQMFGQAEEVFLRARERARQWHLTPRGFADLLREQLYDKFDPIIRRQREAEMAGKRVDDKLRMDWLFDEHPLADNLTYTWLRRVWDRVVKPLEAAEISLEDVGEYLFARRIMADRAGVANPGGHTPATARAALLRMRLDLGQKRMTLLERGAEAFHDYVFETVREAAQAGLISGETFRSVIVPNRRTYAAFRTIDHVEDYVPAGIYQTVGTLKDAENPWLTTVLKVIAMRRAIQYQRAKVGAVKFLQEYFPDEVDEARTLWNGSRMVPQRPKARERALVELREDGKWVGYEVPVDVARMFEQVDPAQASGVVRALDWVFRKGFYNVWVKFNPIFQLAYSPIRDAQRFYVNMPRAGAVKLAAEYLKAVPVAIRRLRGVDDPIITDMYENFAMATLHDSFARNVTGDGAFGEILREFHLLPEAERPGWRQSAVVRPVMGLLNSITYAGQIFEAAPKIAAYRVLTGELGMGRREAASYVRNYVGVPNYLRKGRHGAAAGAFLPFWNVALQGVASDGALMTGRERNKSAAGWWVRWALAGGAYAIVSALARSGVMGDEPEEWFGGMSEYDFQNFNVVPLGMMPGGDFGRKVIFAKIPQDEMHRMTSGLLKLFITTVVRHADGSATRPLMNDLMALAGYAGGNMPGVNPAIGIAAKWMDYVNGNNPYDSFRGKHVLSNNEMLAGGWYGLKPMLAMTWNDAGLGNFYRFNPEAETTTELVVTNTPIVQRLVKVSDRGFAEQQQATMNAEDAVNARLKLSMPENVQRISQEHNFLRSLGNGNRSPQQQARYDQLKVWNRVIFTPAYESAQEQVANGLRADFAGLDVASEPWEK